MSKLLLGVPLYGYGPSGAITSRDLIELHEEDGGETMGEEFEWDVKVQEHYWKCVDGDVRFPTPQFLVRRFEEARKRGTNRMRRRSRHFSSFHTWFLILGIWLLVFLRI